MLHPAGYLVAEGLKLADALATFLTQVHPFSGLFASTECPKCPNGTWVPFTALGASHLSPSFQPISVVGGWQMLQMETDLETREVQAAWDKGQSLVPREVGLGL